MTAKDFVKHISWIGHDGFQIKGSKTVYFDPFEISGGEPADILCVTYDHYDHLSIDDIAKIKKEDTVIVTEKNSAKSLEGDVRVVIPGDTLEIEGVKIAVVPSYNTNKKFHPKDKGYLGFIVEMDGVKVYHAGDTDVIPEMREIETDIALLPVSGTYVMTAEEAAEAAMLIRAELIIPMHFGSIVGSNSDAEIFKKLLEGKKEVMVLQKRN